MISSSLRVLNINRYVWKSIQLRTISIQRSGLLLAASKSDDKDKDKDFFAQAESKPELSYLPVPVKPSLFESLKEKLGFRGGYRFDQQTMVIASLRLYLCIQYQVDYDKFFKKLQLPDVMYSFCLITFLHVWLVSVALAQYGRSGLFVRRMLIQNMWKDIETRAKKLNANMSKDTKKNTYEHLNDIFRTHMFGLDEGLLSDDTILAGAIWRHLFEMRELGDFSVLGEMCDYIRKNVHHLENMTQFDLLKDGVISFVSFEQEKLDHNKIRSKIYKMIQEKQLIT